MTDREAFKKWAGDDLDKQRMEDCWEAAWQAALLAERERIELHGYLNPKAHVDDRDYFPIADFLHYVFPIDYIPLYTVRGLK